MKGLPKAVIITLLVLIMDLLESDLPNSISMNNFLLLIVFFFVYIVVEVALRLLRIVLSLSIVKTGNDLFLVNIVTCALTSLMLMLISNIKFSFSGFSGHQLRVVQLCLLYMGIFYIPGIIRGIIDFGAKLRMSKGYAKIYSVTYYTLYIIIGLYEVLNHKEVYDLIIADGICSISMIAFFCLTRQYGVVDRGSNERID